MLMLALASSANAGVVTLTAGSTNSTTLTTNSLVLGPHEVAELIAYPFEFSSSANLYAVKDGLPVRYAQPRNVNGGLGYLDPFIVAGPAVIQFISVSPVLCTFRVTPEPFPPDRTIIVSPGTNRTEVTLECSTNLVQWSAATNGIYGPMPEAKFFRIKVEKLQ